MTLLVQAEARLQHPVDVALHLREGEETAELPYQLDDLAEADVAEGDEPCARAHRLEDERDLPAYQHGVLEA